ncbi:hypothetical protein HMPREF0063_10214 [Aeromicrobium marinum DSM 15272]|uniref:Uncharacterized protein n=1 Tax=Aeromicrobium marinum DSM 15272 TaxID=585531 RepID=E2S857_9ACTN|nr:hypothetical protein [Aeromicrobium marinum]EFQ84362.1 hypothetical protein HMPREF0063_10214 [Aeromicrobium marinum DSM 15272]
MTSSPESGDTYRFTVEVDGAMADLVMSLSHDTRRIRLAEFTDLDVGELLALVGSGPLLVEGGPAGDGRIVEILTSLNDVEHLTRAARARLRDLIETELARLPHRSLHDVAVLHEHVWAGVDLLGPVPEAEQPTARMTTGSNEPTSDVEKPEDHR